MKQVGPLGSNDEVSLFAQGERTPGHRMDDERAYQFYNRVKGPRWDDHRSFVDRCYHNLPTDEMKHAKGRWYGGQDDQLAAVWWEMYLHESLLTAGFTVEVEPTSEAGTKVDFHAVKGGADFYVEAHRVGLSKEQRSAAIREGEVVAALNAIVMPGWRLDLKSFSVGLERLGPAEWVSHVKNWLNECELDALPDPNLLRLQHDDWVMEASAVRVLQQSHPPQRFIRFGTQKSGGRRIGSPISIPMHHKIDRYPGLDPLLLAISIDSFHSAEEEVVAAILTAPDTHPSLDADSVSVSRHEGGHWMTSMGQPINTHISGLILGVERSPGDLDRAHIEYWPNPWADVPVATPCPAWETVTLNPEGLVRTAPLQDARTFFGLPMDWGTAPPYATERSA